ncbi:MAG: hypothetical protein GY796_01870 [Chloroflexi bacterium]|nr:hypothetical protein [Chloroflexota bacterium]
MGSTHLIYGSVSGLTGSGDHQIFDAGNPETYDNFGFAVTAADFNGDGYADLAVGAHRDDLAENDAGSLFVFHSDDSRVLQANSQNYYQGHNGLSGALEQSDYFGSALLYRVGIDGVRELYSVPLLSVGTPAPVKLNDDLALGESVGSYDVSMDNGRVLYKSPIGPGQQGLFSVPLSGGIVQQVNGPLVAGGNDSFILPAVRGS